MGVREITQKHNQIYKVFCSYGKGSSAWHFSLKGGMVSDREDYINNLKDKIKKSPNQSSKKKNTFSKMKIV